MNFDEAAISHLAWKERLLGYLDKSDTSLDAAGTSADDRCALGKWIEQEGVEYAAYAEYKTLKQEHAHFHKVAGDVVRGAQLGLSIRPETLLAMDSEYGRASTAVVAGIMKLKRMTQAHAAGASAAAGAKNNSVCPPVELRPVDWDQSYSVGVEELDEHHQYFFCLTNILQNAIKEGTQKSAIGMLLSELSGYAHYHFTREEELMERAKYQELARHRREHEIFVDRLGKLSKDFQSANGEIGLAMLDFVRSWLVKHIQQVDKRYSAQVKAYVTKR